MGRKPDPRVGENGYVRGWHRDCPAVALPFLGTYKLRLAADGTVFCEACGAPDLVDVCRG